MTIARSGSLISSNVVSCVTTTSCTNLDLFEVEQRSHCLRCQSQGGQSLQGLSQRDMEFPSVKRAFAKLSRSLCFGLVLCSVGMGQKPELYAEEPSRGDSARIQTSLIQSTEILRKEWHSNDNGVPGDAWVVEDGVLQLRKGKNAGRGGNILTHKEYGDFELEFEFKNSIKGNSGIKYRVARYGSHWLGFEYQIYDEASFKNVPPRGVTGSIYDLYEPTSEKPLNPPGEWNRAKVVVKGNSIEHWLNDVLIAQAEIGSKEWDKRYQESKFNETPTFGRNPKGKLMITDHGSQVWIRNLVITELNIDIVTQAN